MSEDNSQLDLAKAHRRFSADCFNRTWTWIEKPDRTAADDEAMVLCALASLWHWTQRTDCTDQNLSIGHWQVSRVYALVGQGENATRHATESLKFAQNCSPCLVGYAHEAGARAALVSGDGAKFQEHLGKARSCAATETHADDRKALEQDLQSLEAAAEMR